ncbi:MAG: CotH kinase family protein [Bacteroidales bacterium]|nr:CotH kinase family protein [Bacteroidales bacterium]
MRNISFLTFLFFVSFITQGQPVLPENGIAFDDSQVNRVDILIHPDTLDWIYNNVESNIEWHATFIYSYSGMKDTIDEVGFRLRGNTSRGAAKKSFKVSFNTFHPGRKWEGLEKMNLNGEHNDPSISRSKICWDLLHDFGIPAPRSNHVELYINGNYYGLYLNVEHIDEEFVESRFGNKDGNLFKCLYPADLDYLGSNPDAYKYVTSWGSQPYDLKTNTAVDDYSDLATFIDKLNNSDDEDFLCALDTLFNIYDYLKIMAVDIFIGNWDGYIYNQNNFYLYHNSANDLFEYIPYDLDNTLGIDWIDRDWAHRDIYDWAQHGNNVRPLYSRMIDNEQLREQFSHYLNTLLQEYVNPDSWFDYLDDLKTKIQGYVPDDPYYPLDYGFTYSDFLNSFEDSYGGHVDYGIKPYAVERRTAALDQLEINNITPVIKYMNWELDSNDLWAGIFVEDENVPSEVSLFYTFNNGSQLELSLLDDGLHNDGEANDGYFANTLQDIENNTVIRFQFYAEDVNGNENLLPCDPLVISIMPSEDPEIYINEFMASNTTTITDEYGEYDDWVELYNAGSSSVWLGDKYLSDNFDNPSKWLMPDDWIQPGAFYLIWADDDPDQGPNHTNFKLDADGEELAIFDSEGTGYFVIDSVSFGIQPSDLSFGRMPDGGPEWVFFNEATPGLGNTTDIRETNFLESDISMYPNPCTVDILNFSRKCDVNIFDVTGKSILIQQKSKSVDISKMPKGMYVVCIDRKINKKLFIQ